MRQLVFLLFPPPPPSPPLVQIGLLCTSDCSGTHCVDQLGFKLKRPLGSTSQALGLKVCTTKALVRYLFFILMPHTSTFLPRNLFLFTSGRE